LTFQQIKLSHRQRLSEIIHKASSIESNLFPTAFEGNKINKMCESFQIEDKDIQGKRIPVLSL